MVPDADVDKLASEWRVYALALQLREWPGNRRRIMEMRSVGGRTAAELPEELPPEWRPRGVTIREEALSRTLADDADTPSSELERLSLARVRQLRLMQAPGFKPPYTDRSPMLRPKNRRERRQREKEGRDA